ncbi:hypothetical protein J3Q64DRAFT_1738782 [Phycomyces blakesleeanus]|uniref:Uncharacterized protein n=1 Tax=Phycomyces blakesleeanus TaxID=4837 RepID=A0ABR3B0V1_PHYBL
MKILSPIGSLTLAATMLLQLGSFANAMPTFTDTSYLADAEACADFRITYPSATGNKEILTIDIHLYTLLNEINEYKVN